MESASKQKVKKDKVKEESSNSNKDKKSSKCVSCGKKAEYCMRGIPDNTYCRACAEAYFKFLNYLDKI